MTRYPLGLEEDGRLASVSFSRCGGKIDDGDYDFIPFGSGALAEADFGGYTIATRIHAGLWFVTLRVDGRSVASAQLRNRAPGERNG